MIYEKVELTNIIINIENTDASDPYTAIGSKAFLSCKDVCEIMLPDTICEIGDWAFAHMKALKKITVPARKITLGRDVFLDCTSLKEIAIYPDMTENEGMSRLMSTCVSVLKQPALLDFELASRDNSSWCEMYDEELLFFLKKPDDVGFVPHIVGWFNDEGEDEQLARFVEKMRKDKLEICFLRLKYCKYLAEKTRDALISYVKECFDLIDIKLEGPHSYLPKNSNDFAWLHFRDVLSDDLSYVKIAAENNLLTSAHKSDLIANLNSRGASPEIAAYLLALDDEKQNMEQLFEL